MKRKKEEIKPLEPRVLRDWLKENDVVGCICKTTHPEVVKQSLPILIFAAKHNMMDLTYFNSLYDYVLEKHESVKNTILTSIIQIVPHLSHETMQLFFEHIVNVTPIEEYDNETIQFFHSYTTLALSKSAIASEKQTNWYGLPLLSRYIAEAEKLPNNSLVMSKVAWALVDLLLKPECQNQRMVYMDSLLENIKNLRAVTDSLIILARIIATHFKTSKRKKPTVNAVIESLEQKHQMLQLLFKELVHFKENYSKEESHHSQSVSPKMGKLFYLEQVSVRLDFLQFILSNSSLTLNAEQTDILWDSFITRSLSSMEREKMFMWLQNATKYLSGSIGSNPILNTSGGNLNGTSNQNVLASFDDVSVVVGTNSALAESIIEHLFEEKMIGMDFSSLSPAGFQLFDNYFLIVNLRSGKLKKISARGIESSVQNANIPSPNVSQQNGMLAPPSALNGNFNNNSNGTLHRQGSNSNIHSASNETCFTINADKLLGISELCSIALESENSVISSAAIWRLNSLHSYHSGESLKARASKWREDHVATWISHLESSFSTLDALSKSLEDSSSKFSNENDKKREKAEIQVERCLNLLKNLVEDFDERTKKKTVNTHASREIIKQVEGKQLTFFVRTEKGLSPVIQMLSTDTVIQLRYKIAELISAPPRSIRICTSDRELKEEGKTLAESRLQDRQTLIIRKRSTESNNTISSASAALKRPGSFFSLSSAFGITPAEKKANEKKEAPRSPKESDEGSYDDDPAEALVAEGLKTMLGGLLGLNVSLPIKRRNLQSQVQPTISESKSHTDLTNQSMQKMLQEPPKGTPSQILSTQKYFKAIYSVLNYRGKKIGQKASELLSQLQINEGLFNQMKSLSKENSEKPNWNELLDKNSTFKLIYSLQIVQIFIQNPNIADSKKEENATETSPATWRKRFIEKGGLHHLLSILSEPVLGESIGRNKFYGLLLGIINSLTLSANQRREPSSRRPSHSFRDRSVLSAIDPQSLVLKLLEISFDAARTCDEEIEDAKRAVQNSLDMLIACVFSAQDVLWYFYGYEQLKDWLFCTILTPSEKEIREGSLKLVKDLCSKGLVASSNLPNAVESNGKEKHELGLRSTVSEEISPTKKSAENSHKRSKSTEQPRSPVIFFLDLLLSYLPQVERYPANCEQYFELLVILFRNYMDSVPPEENEARRQDPKWKDLLQRLLDQISSHRVLEKTSTGPPDRVIIGLLNFCRIFVRKFPSLKTNSSAICLKIIQETFSNCLFATPNAESEPSAPPPRCKTMAAREAAFSLLTEIVSDSPENCAGLCSLLFKQIDQLALSKSWGYAPVDNEKSEYGYVGLQNLGATCYMNSLVQQLNFIPDFKKGLFAVDMKKSIEEKKELDQNMLYQTQLLFSHLQESAKRYYNPTNFCNTLKDYEGRPINTSVQMDCNEFSNMLFDKLEGQLKGTKMEHLLRDVFSGTFCNQLICKECPHSSERDEPFYTLSLEILRQKDILESLKLFIKGEMLVDDNKYFCDKCNRAVETLKRCVIKDLPNILLIHLKRFEFDYEKMKHIKLNDRCEFPYLNDLDMEPFTKEGLMAAEGQPESFMDVEKNGENSTENSNGEDKSGSNRSPDYYRYELVGVVVHTGTTDFGHYYSFVKERTTSNGKSEPNWFEFNDTTVSPFNPKEIPSCCFGGTEEVNEFDRMTGKNQVVSRVKNYNAYILVYQRKSTINKGKEEVKVSKEENNHSKIPNGKEEESLEKEEQVIPNGKEEISEDEKEEKNPNAPNGKVEDKSDNLNKSQNRLRESQEALLRESVEDDEHPLGSKSLASNSEDNFIVKLTNALKERENHNLPAQRSIRKECPVPSTILTDIWDENTEFLMERSVLSQDFFSFVWNFVNLFTHKTEQDLLRVRNDSSFLHTVKFATIFLFQVYSHARDKPMFDGWVNHLRGIFGTSPQASKWLLNYLTENRRQIKLLFLHCQFENLRVAFCGIVGSAINCLSEMPEEKMEDSPRSETSELALFLHLLLSNKMLLTVRKHNRWCAQYFLLIKYYCQIGPHWRKYLLETNVITKLVDYSMASGEWGPKSDYKSMPVPLRLAPQNMPHIVQTFVLLARSCRGPFLLPCEEDAEENHVNPGSSKVSPLLLPEPTFTMNQTDIKSLFDRFFIGRLIRETVDLPSTIDLMQHVCWEDQKATKLFVGLFKETLAVGFTPEMCKPWFSIMSALLEIKDSNQNWRLDLGLMNCLSVLETHVRKKELTDAFVKYLMKLAKKNDVAKVWLFKHKDSLNSILASAGYKLS
eukprot:TRINITY_DN3429_c0_g1_i1.p1 TRINITY_DN3429_c0_g1~~TRINITY_DN3429_c0_g1_i1.p1  ORF type:complete len:2268 (-),score=754.02 TRINITY_DN3429_c0_g1_i1:12-6815(-)